MVSRKDGSRYACPTIGTFRHQVAYPPAISGLDVRALLLACSSVGPYLITLEEVSQLVRHADAPACLDGL